MADFLQVTDSRTNRDYRIPIENNIINGQDIARIQSGASETMRVYDPGFANTAIMHSSVAHGNGKTSRLEFRGQNVYDLVDKHDFEEVAFLLIFDRIPSSTEKNVFRIKLAQKCLEVSEHVESVVRAFPKSSPFMTIMIGALSAALAGHPSLIPAIHGSHVYSSDMDATDDSVIEVIATYAVCLGLAYAHKYDTVFRQAEVGQSYIRNVFTMMGLVDPKTGSPDPKVLAIMEQWWIVSADHELAHSTCATLLAGSAQADPLSCVISGITSGYGILHLGATENSYRQQKAIGKVENVAAIVAECKAGKRRLMGVGHRIYKANNDPRLVIVKKLLNEMKSIGYADPLIDTSYELEKHVNADAFFARKSLFINFDLYWWGLYTGLGVDINAVVPFFFASRVCGLMAHWRELMTQNTKLWRPNMIYASPISTRPTTPEEGEAKKAGVNSQTPASILHSTQHQDSIQIQTNVLVGGVR